MASGGRPGLVAVSVVAFFSSWNEHLFSSALTTRSGQRHILRSVSAGAVKGWDSPMKITKVEPIRFRAKDAAA